MSEPHPAVPARAAGGPRSGRVLLLDLQRADAQIERLMRRHLDRVAGNEAVLPAGEREPYLRLEIEALERAAAALRPRARRMAQEQGGIDAQAQ